MLSSSEWLSERKCNCLMMWWGVSTKLYIQPVAAETGLLNNAKCRKKRHAVYRRSIYSNSELKPSTHKLSLLPRWQAKLVPRDTANIIFTEWTGKYFDILIDCSSNVLSKNVKMSLAPASRVWISVDFLVLSDIKLNLFDRWSRHFFWITWLIIGIISLDADAQYLFIQILNCSFHWEIISIRNYIKVYEWGKYFCCCRLSVSHDITSNRRQTK